MSETDAVQEQVRALPWVTYCEKVPSGDTTIEHVGATHYIRTDLPALRWNHEIHTLQNLGVTIVAVSARTDATQQLYVAL